jgi:phosphoribosyl 1,2-cyclic phosphodiesterase
VTIDMMFQFAVLGSGSRGNSALLRQDDGPGLLIDMGLGPRVMEQRLASVGSNWSRVSSVILTHTHGDHLNSATLQLMVRQQVVIYCHEGHRRVLEEDQGFLDLERMGLVRYYDGGPFLAPCGFRVEPIAALHDGGPTFGFRIETVPRRRARAMSLGYLADTGTWTDTMADSLADVDILGIEFNHDVAMQRASGRSRTLIERNLGDRGHLSNRQGAELVRSVLQRSSRERIQHLVLLHLSEQCNRPELAVGEAEQAVRHCGRRIAVHAARQSPAHPVLNLTRDRQPAVSLEGKPSRARVGSRNGAGLAPLLPGLNLDS